MSATGAVQVTNDPAPLPSSPQIAVEPEEGDLVDDGTLYVTFVASDFLNRVRNATPRHVVLARSSDSSRTSTTSRVFQASDGDQDRGPDNAETVSAPRELPPGP